MGIGTGTFAPVTMARTVASSIGGSSTPTPPALNMSDRLGAAFSAFRAARARGAGSGDSATKGKKSGGLLGSIAGAAAGMARTIPGAFTLNPKPGGSLPSIRAPFGGGQQNRQY